MFCFHYANFCCVYYQDLMAFGMFIIALLTFIRLMCL
ncbi:putative holin-like toxin [Phascolarctobacterium sp.]